MTQPDCCLSRLLLQLESSEEQMMRFLDTCQINRVHRNRDPDSPLFIIGPSHAWAPLDDQQRRDQIELNRRFGDWFEQFRSFLLDAPTNLQERVDKCRKFVLSRIEQKNDWSVPETIRQAKEEYEEETRILRETLASLRTTTSELVLVPDTNAIIAAPDAAQYKSIAGREDYTLVFMPTVLSELDKLKTTHRDQSFREKVDGVIRRIKGFRKQGNLLKGVTVAKTVTVKMVAAEPRFEHALKWLDPNNNDDRIIASVLELQRSQLSAAIWLVTADINLQNKAEMASLPYTEPPA